MSFSAAVMGTLSAYLAMGAATLVAKAARLGSGARITRMMDPTREEPEGQDSLKDEHQRIGARERSSVTPAVLAGRRHRQLTPNENADERELIGVCSRGSQLSTQRWGGIRSRATSGDDARSRTSIRDCPGAAHRSALAL
jgi:hypothetical protein